eukprot:m.219100 g.219100  ORF g.219100 m.219100 type:complete len:188 (-) comp15107_c0_seq1:62-625(-)
MGVREANNLVQPVLKRRSITSPDCILNSCVNGSVHSIDSERVLGVDLSSVVHTLFPTSSQPGTLSLCKDPGLLVELASLDESNSRFASLFQDVFSVEYFKMRFGIFLYHLRAQRPNLLFVVDGPPPVPKQVKAKAQRAHKYEEALRTIANSLLDRNLGNDAPSIDQTIRKACAQATHHWMRQFLEYC